MIQMIKFPSIGQFRDVIKGVELRTWFAGKDENGNAILDKSRPLPTLKFRGSVKTHGSNGSLALDKDGNFWVQSRERILSLEHDNMGFCAWALKNKAELVDILQHYLHIPESPDVVVLAGEWCGAGIQKGVAVSELPKMFIVFGLKVGKIDQDGVMQYKWIGHGDVVATDISMYNVEMFQTWEMDIDFSNPFEAQNKLVEITNQVEQECPVGKYFGVSGIGEGVVWEHDSDKYDHLLFKCKGEKHANSRVKTLVPVDVEKHENAKAFAEAVTQIPRLEQGFSFLREMEITPERKNVGVYLKWVSSDVIKEHQEEIVANSIDVKAASKYIQDIAKKYYFEKCE